MKIQCKCGYIIPDQTDGLPYKAMLLADQDWQSVTDSPGEPNFSIYDLIRRTRPVFQCRECGRLTFDDPVTGEMLWFMPENDHRKRALGSKDGNAGKVALIGAWQPELSRGELFWGESGDLPGGFEVFDSKAAFERRFEEVRGMLQKENRLLDARRL